LNRCTRFCRPLPSHSAITPTQTPALTCISHKFVRNAPSGLRRAPQSGVCSEFAFRRVEELALSKVRKHRAETCGATRCAAGGFLMTLPGLRNPGQFPKKPEIQRAQCFSAVFGATLAFAALRTAFFRFRYLLRAALFTLALSCCPIAFNKYQEPVECVNVFDGSSGRLMEQDSRQSSLGRSENVCRSLADRGALLG
jgi:hypothetical protein